jgi:hypothetical protein
MQVFFRTRAELEAFLDHLPSLRCPFCGAVGNVVRHGYIRWFRSPEENGIRAWRIRCKKSPRHRGCGRAPSIRLGDCIPRRCFDAKQLWAFIQALLRARSIKAAWEQAGIAMSLDTGYRLYRHLDRCQSVLRTHLCARAPPPKAKTGVPLFQVFAHLKEAFGNKNPIQSYQEHFQRSVLAIA